MRKIGVGPMNGKNCKYEANEVCLFMLIKCIVEVLLMFVFQILLYK